MKLEIKEATLTITIDEARELRYCLLRNLEHTIDTYWVNHPTVYEQQARENLYMVREFSRITGDWPEGAASDLKIRLNRAVEAKAKLNGTA